MPSRRSIRTEPAARVSIPRPPSRRFFRVCQPCTSLPTLRRERKDLVKNDIRLNLLGRWEELEPSIARELRRTLEATRECRGMTFNVALNYSGRCEIVDACRMAEIFNHRRGTGANNQVVIDNEDAYRANVPSARRNRRRFWLAHPNGIRHGKPELDIGTHAWPAANLHSAA